MQFCQKKQENKYSFFSKLHMKRNALMLAQIQAPYRNLVSGSAIIYQYEI